MRRIGAAALLRCSLLALLLTQPAAEQLLRYRAAEEGPPDLPVGNVAADLGIPVGSGEVTFSLESGLDYLKIDNMTGELSTNGRRIDREKLEQCQMVFDEKECFIDFEVSVIGPAQSWVDLFEGRVIILDINDNTPSFPSPVLSLSVEENRPIGTLYLLPTATDRDFGRNGVQRYELLQLNAEGGGRRAKGGPPGRARGEGGVWGRSSVFELQVADTPEGGKQPQLIVKGDLDREQRDAYELTLRARDGGDPPRSSQATLRVTITDVNDNSPTFERELYEAELTENSAPGTPVLQVRAQDADAGPNGQVEYVWGGGSERAGRLLRLDAASGWISVLQRVDREELSRLRVTVTARDRGTPPRAAATTVILSVRDRNDNPPLIAIRKIGRIPLREGVALVPEGVAVDTPVALVQVSDRDQGENGAVTCTVAGDVPFQLKPAGDFDTEQNRRKYFLHTAAPLDYEATQLYSVVIIAVDSGSPSLSSNSSLLVRVADINDHAPVFLQSVLEVSVPENNAPGEVVARLQALDADSGKNAEISYSLDASVKGIFSIDSSSGDLSAVSVLDREEVQRYQFKVLAKDKGVPPLQTSATLLLHILDTNDNAPVFPQDTFTFHMKENLPGNSPVGMVTAMDVDEEQNGEISLFIREEEEGDFFISNDTIFSRLPLDREERESYVFVVMAVDGGDPPRSASVTVSLFVTDVNDNAPIVTFPSNGSYTLLPPSSSTGTIVRTVVARDADAGVNAELTFRLVGGNPFQLFEVEAAGGAVWLARPLEPRHRGLHRLVVRVTDGGSPPRCCTALLHVYVNHTLSNGSAVQAAVARSLGAPLWQDVAGDAELGLARHRLSVAVGALAGAVTVLLVILLVVMVRSCVPKSKKAYEAGRAEPPDRKRAGRGGGRGGRAERPSVAQYRAVSGGPASPDLARHYQCGAALPSVLLHPHSPPAGEKKHQAVQQLPPANTFVGTAGPVPMVTEHSDQTSHKYSKQPPRRVTFCATGPSQDPSGHDSGLEDCESCGAAAPLGDSQERTSPEGSVGEAEGRESDSRPLPDVTLTGKSTQACNRLQHTAPCWSPMRTPPSCLSSAGRAQSLLSRKMTSSSYDTLSRLGQAVCHEDAPPAQPGGHRTASCHTLSRREVYL
ncbi:LOW QUALITY PROTEIN: protocadherin-7-like [Megalops cyprinoides]|uniref:LOW QUALITY PROTEIN: protocadherin-7-like n=1 Tax=Megalops cyprinoides TaxID=118141 RepID=UPI001863C6A9|nr:LOW QUALITY PROTEIN: protocadherin-7-like [Megalops cyprinoides]